jgi:hypothetical protein
MPLSLLSKATKLFYKVASVNLFKHRNFQYDIIIWAVGWYCKCGISYRELEDMLCE